MFYFLRSAKLNTSTIDPFVYEYFVLTYIYIYILNRWKDEEVVGGWTENEDERNPSLYAFSFSDHMHMPNKAGNSQRIIAE